MPSRVRSILLVTLLALSSAGHAQQGDEPAYRVAGIIVIDELRAVAMIESSAGTQENYRLGDMIDDWQVIAIERQAITLRRANLEVELPLEGKLVNFSAEAVEITDDDFLAANNTVDFERTVARLQTLQERSNAGEIALDYETINRVLRLPEETRIRNIAGDPVESPTALLGLAIAHMQTGWAVRLMVSDSRADWIYLMPTQADE